MPHDTVRLRLGAHLKALEGEPDARTVDVIASTDAVDAHDEIVLQTFRLERYLKNPVVLWNHGKGATYGSDDTNLTLPIGTASNVRVEGNRLLATLRLVDARANPLAEKVWQGIQQGSIGAVSVALRPHSVWREVKNDTELYVLADNELVEISLVAIPANPDAVLAEKSDRAETRTLLRALSGAAQGTRMLHVIKALGLAADASEAEALLALERLRGLERDLFTLTQKSTSAEALAAVTGLRASAARLVEVERELEGERAIQREGEVVRLLDEGARVGKVLPAKRSFFLSHSGADKDGKGADPKRLAALIETWPKEVEVDGTPTKTPPIVPETLTPSEKAMCERKGWKEADYAASKATTLGKGA